ncbi:MAG TPA: sulfite exporter TauE/SafE family protein [Desulfotomaculum sp.]|nr:MAG: membrane protein [Peptococcaceae bacterium BRH_c8a]KJS77045.1 MAG: membrane protein [Desulfotomaculum sp. BICA1-6]HBX24084.1 sulfite exporter TauE/SafE family protein [Desulfotomaculum sp.]
MKSLYENFMYAARAHAKWEIATTQVIVKDRKKLLILLVLFLPILIPAIAHAGSVLPGFIGGKSSFGPSFFSPTTFYGSILIGVCAGLITGCIGAGGGFIITPALMSLGVKGIMAVGTDMFHIFAKAIMGTAVHKKLGNVHVGLAIAFLAGSFIGVTGGGVLNRAIFNHNPVVSDFVISMLYVFMLGFLGFYALADYLKSKNKIGDEAGDAHGGPSGLTGTALKMQSIKIPPMITFDEDIYPGGRKISGVFVALCGGLVGFVAAIMGVGGGFLTFPIFVYALGVSSFTTVGTDILQIIFTAGYGSITQYAVYGYVFYTLAMGMLVGSLLGIQIGAITTKVVPGIQIRGFYAVAILAGFINRLFVLPDKLRIMGYINMSQATTKTLETIGAVIFFGLVTVFALWIISTFVRNIPNLRAEAMAASSGGKGVSK